MHRSITLVAILILTVLLPAGCSSSKPKNAVTFEYGGRSAELAVSDSLVRDVLEDALDSDLDCDGDLDPQLRSLLESLSRKSRSSGSIRGEGSNLVAKRRGGRLEMRIDDVDGGRIEATMPWAVAECLLGRSTTLDEALGSGRVPIEVEVTGSDGTRIAARMGS